MVMPVRAAVGAASAVEIVIAILLLIAATVGLARLGARVYRGAILSTGRRVRVLDAWRRAKRPKAEYLET